MHPLNRKVTVLTVVWLAVAGLIGLVFVRGVAAEIVMSPTVDDY